MTLLEMVTSMAKRAFNFKPNLNGHLRVNLVQVSHKELSDRDSKKGPTMKRRHAP